MNKEFKTTEENPRESANFFSRLFICWISGLMRKGYKQPLNAEDLHSTIKSEKLKYNTELLENEWNKELSKKKPSLLKAIFRVHFWRIFANTILLITLETSRFAQPILISQLMQYFDNKISLRDAGIYAAAVCASMFYNTLARHPQFIQAQLIGLRIRLACTGLIYKKLLRSNINTSNDNQSGQIINLLSNDAYNLDLSIAFLAYVLIAPLQIFAAIYLLITTISWKIISGLALIGLALCFTTFIGKLYTKLKMKISSSTDRRVGFTSELLSNIKLLKFNCWEKLFEESMSKKRKEELNLLKKDAVFLSINQSLIYELTPWTVYISVSVFLIYLADTPLLPSYVIYIISYYGKICNATGVLFGRCFPLIISMLASTKRFEMFLLKEEKIKNTNNNIAENPHIEAKEFSCSYHKDFEGFGLKNFNLTVKSNELIAVIGSVGSGKSTFLMALLNEMPFLKGSLSVHGKIFYVSQEPWIFNGTLKENITFGMPYEPEKFNKIVKLCCLDQDFKLLQNGEDTHIGEKGINLSGGQRARVSIARAMYSDAQIFLFDDPLSALDANVGKTIYNNCIVGHLKSKIRILVTNQAYLISNVDRIMVLKKGELVNCCTHEELIQSNDPYVFDLGIRKANDNQLELQKGSTETVVHNRDSEQEKEKEQTNEAINFRGSVGWRIYVNYLRSGGGLIGIFALFTLFAATQAIFILSDYWLSNWATKESKLYDKFHSMNNTQISNISDNTSAVLKFMYSNREYNFHVYTGLIFVILLLLVFRALVCFGICINASFNLHKQMFIHVMNTNLRFFHINPLGRIINRFSQDIGSADNVLPKTLFEFLQLFMMVIGSIAFSAILNYWILIPLVPLMVLFYFVRSYFLVTSREIKRLEAVCRSPVFVYVSTTIHGLTTIRAANIEEIVTKEFESHQDVHTSAYTTYWCINRWFGIRLEWLLLIYSCFLVLSSVFARDNIGLTSGGGGLILIQLIVMGENFQWCIRQSCEIENLMTSVERIMEYGSLKMEELYNGKIKATNEWLKHGAIKFDNVSFSYNPDDSKSPNVLRNLTFEIKPNEKIGIVGRTGAGKSSISQAILRIAEPSGKILVDEVDIKELSLNELRSKIAIIPQEPVLFSGTLRTNLDPFNEKTDLILWEVLEEVQLKEHVKVLNGGLDTPISKGGSNFSLGQKQLICLARAILKKSNILIVDEATANIDLKTDKLVQQVIRKYFKECTVLTIAHRLNTIIDCDRILCLENGELVNFDTPNNLLNDTKSIFYDLVHKLNQSEIDHLKEIVENQINTNI